jgi:type II secretory pathway pseudopilin PulG
MKGASPRPLTGGGFTLIELLGVIVILVILAAVLLPQGGGGGPARVKEAQIEMSQIANAIQAYHSCYNRYPVSDDALASIRPPHFAPSGEDFTFGGIYRDQNGKPISVGSPGAYQAMNAEVIAILMNMEKYPNGTPTPNGNHDRNPQKIKFLNAAMATDTTSSGVGLDGVYRDPWGNPYIISIDANNDDKCRDAFHKLRRVSQSQANGPAGYFGLTNAIDASGNGDHFEFSGSVMVWSAGPDGKIDTSADADHGANKDNVLSWK